MIGPRMEPARLAPGCFLSGLCVICYSAWQAVYAGAGPVRLSRASHIPPWWALVPCDIISDNRASRPDSEHQRGLASRSAHCARSKRAVLFQFCKTVFCSALWDFSLNTVCKSLIVLIFGKLSEPVRGIRKGGKTCQECVT